MTATLIDGTPPSVFTRVSTARRAKNWAATVLVSACFAIALIPLIWLLWTVTGKGYHAITTSAWWTETQRNKVPTTPGGGIWHAIVGTMEQVALCTVISVPFAILVGIYLVEYGRGAFARITTFMVDILTGVPSIVAALFIYALVISTFHGVRTGWLVSLALVILMLPVIVRTTEEMLKLVPNELREASYALGVPKWRTIVRVVLPTAFSGLVTGVMLGIARVAGETAPLLILVGYTADMNASPFRPGQSSLPLEINQQFINLNQASGSTAYHLDAQGHRVAGAAANFAPERMWGTALTLILIVLVLNLLARFIGRFSKVSR